MEEFSDYPEHGLANNQWQGVANQYFTLYRMQGLFQNHPALLLEHGSNHEQSQLKLLCLFYKKKMYKQCEGTKVAHFNTSSKVTLIKIG